MRFRRLLKALLFEASAGTGILLLRAVFKFSYLRPRYTSRQPVGSARVSRPLLSLANI